jgi:hypothetical protein
MSVAEHPTLAAYDIAAILRGNRSLRADVGIIIADNEAAWIAPTIYIVAAIGTAQGADKAARSALLR